jgi:hypothetical protein
MEYLGAWGTLIHENNLKSKISFQTPFNSNTVTKNFVYACLSGLSSHFFYFSPFDGVLTQ